MKIHIFIKKTYKNYNNVFSLAETIPIGEIAVVLKL